MTPKILILLCIMYACVCVCVGRERVVRNCLSVIVSSRGLCTIGHFNYVAAARPYLNSQAPYKKIKCVSRICPSIVTMLMSPGRHHCLRVRVCVYIH